MGADAAGIYISASYITGIDSPENKKFLEGMARKFGDDLKTPNDLSVPQYEGVYLLQARGREGRVDRSGGGDRRRSTRSASRGRAA